jgi:hypothetical protein
VVIKTKNQPIKSVTILAFKNSLEMGVAMSRDIFFAASQALQKKLGYRSDGLVRVATQDGEKVKNLGRKRPRFRTSPADLI